MSQTKAENPLSMSQHQSRKSPVNTIIQIHSPSFSTHILVLLFLLVILNPEAPFEILATTLQIVG
jgi:hypothetical protein